MYVCANLSLVDTWYGVSNTTLYKILSYATWSNIEYKYLFQIFEIYISTWRFELDLDN